MPGFLVNPPIAASRCPGAEGRYSARPLAANSPGRATLGSADPLSPGAGRLLAFEFVGRHQLDSPACRTILSSDPTPHEAAALTERRLATLLRKAGCQGGIDAEAARLREFLAVEHMRQPEEVAQPKGLQLRGLLGQLDAVCTLLTELEAQIDRASARSVATRAAHPAESRLQARTHFGHNFDTLSGARRVRLSVCLNAEVAVDTFDHHFYPYLHHPKSGRNGSVGRQLYRLDGRLLPQHRSLGRRIACATGPVSDARQDQDIGGGVHRALRWPRTRVLRQPDRPRPQEALPLSATRGPRLHGRVNRAPRDPAPGPPFPRRAAIRVGRA